MEIKDQIELVLLDIGKSIKIHSIDKDNTIIEIDYNKYVDELVHIFNEHCQNSQQH
jgi:hypothetical protein